MMRRLQLLILVPCLLAAQTPAEPEAAKRGRVMFFDEGPRCARCHQAEQRGNKIGPDITRLARLHPRALRGAILATATEYVNEVELRSGARFPAIKSEEDENSIKFYDLTHEPAELKTIRKADIKIMRNNGAWKHPPTSMGLTDEQLADLMSFIRFIGYAETKPVVPADFK
jgi:putative heme-binding domain-containing protein